MKNFKNLPIKGEPIRLKLNTSLVPLENGSDLVLFFASDSSGEMNGEGESKSFEFG